MTTSGSRESKKSPAKRLGEHLRRVRVAAKFATQEALAARLSVSNDYVSKAENGKFVPTRDIFEAWLAGCQVSDEARGYLTDLWIIACDSRGGVRQFIEKWFENEGKADFLHLWGLLFMPGQLQTRGYAHAMFLAGGLDEDEAAEQTDIRLGRQSILDDPEPVQVTAVIHELALHFRVGSPEVMIAQLQHLLELSRRPNVVIQVVRNEGYFPGLRGPFEIANGEAIPDTLLMLAVEDQMVEDQELTRKSLALFEKIRGYALSAEDSRAVIVEAIERWKSQQQ